MNKQKKGNIIWESFINQTQEEVSLKLSQTFGIPKTKKGEACLKKISKIISKFFSESPKISNTSKESFLIIGSVLNIKERVSQGDSSFGQVFYILKLDKPYHQEVFYARKVDLTPEKWKQIESLSILNQVLVFKYKKWFNHNQLIDFYPPLKTVVQD